MPKPILAYHFVGHRLRDGRPRPRDGVTLVHHGLVHLCVCGLHASRTPAQAAMYCRDSHTYLCLVEVSENIRERPNDKLAGAKRKILAKIRTRDLIRALYRLYRKKKIPKNTQIYTRQLYAGLRRDYNLFYHDPISSRTFNRVAKELINKKLKEKPRK